MQKLQQLASEKGVGYSNGSAFHYANAPVKSIRLAYAYCHVDDVPEGITYLCEAIRAAQSSAADVAAGD